MKRKPTEEQKAAAEARRESFRALSRQIAAMTPDERAALAARMPAVVTVAGHALSAFNSALLVHQNPTATVVGGFRQWLAANRCVRKGERGAAIWVPAGGRAEATQEGAEPNAEAGERPRFIVGYVFDVTQTQEIAGDAVAAVDHAD